MACTSGTFTKKYVDFVLQVQIPCGYWYTNGLYTDPNNTSKILDFAFLIDSHCVFCVKRCIVEKAKLPSGKECDINVDVTSLIGALHYDFMLPNFHTEKPNTPTVHATLTSAQSICIEDLAVCYDCETVCNNPANSNTTCDNIVYTPIVKNSMLFTNNAPAGVKLYEDPAVSGNLLSAAAFELLKSNAEATTTNPGPANGCKTVVISGQIEISKA